MFRKTPPQTSLLECHFLLPQEKRARLERSWAAVFRDKVLPVIDEEVFRPCYVEDNGRPNKSVRLLVGLMLLKEAEDLTDEQTVEALEFNLQWQHALAVVAEEAHVCEKTLYNFRLRLVEHGRAAAMFHSLTCALEELDGLSTVRQRLDSTHVLPNLRALTRLGLFVETITHFLREVRQRGDGKLARVGEARAKRYLDREGRFADVKRAEARRRLPVVAQDAFALVRLFEHDPEVREWDAYRLLVRLVEEQCTVAGGGADTGGADERVELREPEEISANSLQSPHDPDVTYGHKGKGYEAQLVETCADGNPYQVVTAVEVTDSCASDQRATVPMVDRLQAEGQGPEVLLADTGYGSGDNIVECAERGVTLLARVQDPGHREQAGPSGLEPPASGREADRVGAAEPAALDLGDFAFNEVYSEVFRCPADHPPVDQQATERDYRATFAGARCAACPLAPRCPTRLRQSGDRVLRWRDSAAATARRQKEQREPAFLDAYRLRSGIESTNAEWKGPYGAGRLRVRGRLRVGVALYLKAAALNAQRAVRYHLERLEESLPTLQASALAVV